MKEKKGYIAFTTFLGLGVGFHETHCINENFNHNNTKCEPHIERDIIVSGNQLGNSGGILASGTFSTIPTTISIFQDSSDKYLILSSGTENKYYKI